MYFNFSSNGDNEIGKWKNDKKYGEHIFTGRDGDKIGRIYNDDG